MSAPALKARPEPVRMATRMAGSVSAALRAAKRSVARAREIALRAFGRVRVRMRTVPEGVVDWDRRA